MSDPRPFNPDDVARQTFGTAFRGFDQLEVRAYLAEVAAELATAKERERGLREALAEAKGRSSTAGLDDLDSALGLEAGKVLQAARQAAAEIRTRAEEQVGRLIREATDDAARIREEANAVLVRCTAEAEAAAESIRAEAARSGAASAELAQFRAKEVVAEAQEVRERVLKDLTRRRRQAQQQLDQLRAGRERLLAAYHVVRTTLDEATAELTVAEAEAEEASGTSFGSDAEVDARIEELAAEIVIGSGLAPALDLPPVGGLAAPAPERPAAASEPQPEPAASADDDVQGGDVIDVRSSAADEAAPDPVEPSARRGEPAGASDRRGRRRHVRPVPNGGRARPQGSEVVLPPDDFEGVRILSPEEAAVRSPSAPTPAPPGRPAPRPVPARVARSGGTAEGADEDAGEADAVARRPAAASGAELEAEPEPELRSASEADAPAAEPAPRPEAERAVPGPLAEPTSARTDPDRRPSSESLVAPAPGGGADPATGPTSEPVVEPEPTADAAADGTEAGVDGLFARIRARREESVADAEAVLAEPPPTVAPDPDEEPPRFASAGSEELFERRDQVLEPIERALVKRLKRSLADEQNEVLDALRRAEGTPAVDDLLPGPDEHVARHASVAARLLRDAAQAAADGDPAAAAVDVADLADDLARRVAGDLRDRLRHAVDGAPDDAEALVEGISAAYREWKTSRIAPLATQHVVEAYGRARYAAVPDRPLRWLVDGNAGCGPDCEDNALAGATPKGEPFPTGHLHPPAHPSCRCLAEVDA